MIFSHVQKKKIQPVTFKHIMESVCQDYQSWAYRINQQKKNITGILSIFHNIIYKEMRNRWNGTYNRISNNCDWT